MDELDLGDFDDCKASSKHRNGNNSNEEDDEEDDLLALMDSAK